MNFKNWFDIFADLLSLIILPCMSHLDTPLIEFFHLSIAKTITSDHQ